MKTIEVSDYEYEMLLRMRKKYMDDVDESHNSEMIKMTDYIAFLMVTDIHNTFFPHMDADEVIKEYLFNREVYSDLHGLVVEPTPEQYNTDEDDLYPPNWIFSKVNDNAKIK